MKLLSSVPPVYRPNMPACMTLITREPCCIQLQIGYKKCLYYIIVLPRNSLSVPLALFIIIECSTVNFILSTVVFPLSNDGKSQILTENVGLLSLVFLSS